MNVPENCRVLLVKEDLFDISSVFIILSNILFRIKIRFIEIKFQMEKLQSNIN